MNRKENWKRIKGFDDFYQISESGKVKSFHRKNPKTLKPYKTRDGYLQVVLTGSDKIKKTLTIHSLLADNFLVKPISNFKLVVDHIDNDPSNNSLNNLQFISIRENSSKNRTSSSGLTGVYSYNNSWKAIIYSGKRSINLGIFKTKSEAAAAYQNKLNSINN